jgi:hypothetical protein
MSAAYPYAYPGSSAYPAYQTPTAAAYGVYHQSSPYRQPAAVQQAPFTSAFSLPGQDIHFGSNALEGDRYDGSQGKALGTEGEQPQGFVANLKHRGKSGFNVARERVQDYWHHTMDQLKNGNPFEKVMGAGLLLLSPLFLAGKILSGFLSGFISPNR